jgi:hypothetical protein
MRLPLILRRLAARDYKSLEFPFEKLGGFGGGVSLKIARP